MYQKIILVGNLGADPELRYLQDGTPVTNFSLATNRTWKNQSTGEKEQETTWFRVSTFNKRAEVVNEWLKKGSQCMVEGRLRPDQNGGPRLWQAQDGTVRASYEITADQVTFLSGGARSDGLPEPASGDEKDEIPF